MTPEARAPSPGEAEIGPNAVLQTVRVIEERLGAKVGAAILAEAGIARLPSGERMIREAEAIALHRAIARCRPGDADAIARASGEATADYIIANRIPAPAKALLRLLPAALAAPLLMAAIRKHAWTFVGAGRFTPEGGWRFTIDRKDAGDDPAPPASLFTWYGAVFTRLFRELVAPRAECAMLAADKGEPLLGRYRIACSGRRADDPRPTPREAPA
ncbi:bacteriochlorophyll 4-vinyl reductase [Erythrobacter sp.]|uniref:bacteriochlorophyll 4-vinyl reductase n=1 Tax=Erythrobacter sp. TaxID=1042 RepID=UPI001425F869|nr:bacteriochlorophyll 4-vinyl reductase [Erythrobacter sp.]QIQ87028.1 MAG: bacteriochlorophyll 4-vinyl reductase [Erythrobacter sp.]